LQIDDLAVGLAHAKDDLEMAQAHFGADHHMAAHRGGAVTDTQLKLIASPLLHRCRSRQILHLDRDTLAHVKTVGAGTVGPPGVAVKAGVEVNMPLDQTWQHQPAAEADHGRGVGRDRVGGDDPGDAAPRYADVRKGPIGQPCIPEHSFERSHHHAFPNQ